MEKYFSVILAVVICLIIIICCNIHWKKKRIIHKVCCMKPEEKCRLLNELLEPFGYSYILSQDIFSSRMDAWQRAFGYCTLYDKAAAGAHMIFDSLPVYFYYQGKTWLIEFWKGQYGINTGCEVGIYYANGIVKEEELKNTMFSCVKEEDMQDISFCLSKKGHEIACVNKKHWWLTVFLPGEFSRPSELVMDIRLSFADCDMARAFANGLLQAGCKRGSIRISQNKVIFLFAGGTNHRSLWGSLQAVSAQLRNDYWCSVYRRITKPFESSADRVLYLYFYLPLAFRRLFNRRFRGKL